MKRLEALYDSVLRAIFARNTHAREGCAGCARCNVLAADEQDAADRYRLLLREAIG